MLANDRFKKSAIADVADDQMCLGGDGPVETGRQAVDHHHLFTGVAQFPYHMAANISGAARYEHTHE